MILIPEPQEITYEEGCFECGFQTGIVCGTGAELFPAGQLKECIRQWAGLEPSVIRGEACRGDISLILDPALSEQLPSFPQISSYERQAPSFSQASPLDGQASKPFEQNSSFSQASHLDGQASKPFEQNSSFSQASHLDGQASKPFEQNSSFSQASSFDRQEPSLLGQAYSLEIREEGIRICGGGQAGLLYGVQTLCQMIEQQGAVLQNVTVRDFPARKRRGYYLDQTRGRVLKLSELKRIADRLCRYKINEFQLYVEHTYLFRDLSEMWRDTTPLTAEEILELDEYCARRQIDLVPSLASFGHLYTLLSTKTYEELCELPDASSQPFSFWDRMRHHTVNVADDRVLPLIKGMLGEYMALFRSNRFNLCADETFDLGKGRSKELADQKGVQRIYVDYLKELCTFLTERGKTPMFWGDVICESPELAKELPPETICLTWGYAPDQREDESRKMAETGLRQYLCPGVSGWNHWMNRIADSYENITRMCAYAEKYRAEGVLNTDWGDYGHINHTEHSVPGMIYGAAFSWNRSPVPREEMDRRISLLEYRDGSGKLVELMNQLADCSVFDWYDAVMLYEFMALEEPGTAPDPEGLARERGIENGGVAEAGERLKGLRREIKRTAAKADSTARGLVRDLELTAEGIDTWNRVGLALSEAACGKRQEPAEAFALSERLEKWFMAYKELWRAVGKEGELPNVAEIVFWYADLLRGRKRKSRRQEKSVEKNS
ncbi:MAG: family 20 glycosylhydrolase [Roseburia sp.]|nr:family 20 glycosylhydrolase [Roseburia sp.]MCM1099035.1 family 20 glycosylhydrolase [Ruminococcus flavefaciens]